MNRSSLLVAVVTVILVVSMLAVAPPLSAQEKPAGKTTDKNQAAGASSDKKLTAAASQVTDTGKAAPVIFFPEPLHDFGTIARGAKVSHNFKVINKGDAPLRLTKAKGS